MGIIVNGGVRKQTQRIDALHFAKDTPYETLVKGGQSAKGEQVLNPEVARAVADAIRGVAQEGTAKRVKQAFYKADGSVIAVGGKTGTGDQRFDVYGAGHRLIESRYVNRSATFVFNIGERFFGSMTAYVHGPESAHYDFTSALPVQLLVTLAPSLMPLIEKQDTVMIPGAHVTLAAPAPVGGVQLTDDVATVKPAPEDAQAEEVEAPAKPAAAAPAPAKPAVQAETQARTSKPAARPTAEPADVKPAKPAKPAADAKRPKPAAEGEHPKAVDALHAKPSAPRAKPRAEASEQPKADPAPRQKPPAVEEVLN
jgi:membrane peptidoglycan carboxypeptidase